MQIGRSSKDGIKWLKWIFLLYRPTHSYKSYKSFRKVTTINLKLQIILKKNLFI